MPVGPDKLRANVERDGLPRICLIFGDEPLQAMECADYVRRMAKEAGAGERIRFDVETGFNWEQLAAGASEMSLFAETRLIELRLGTRKPDKNGGAILTQLAEDTTSPDYLLVLADKLDRNAQKAKWFKAVESHGLAVQVRPIKPPQLERWIANRARQLGMNLSRSAAEVIAMRAEGNLLAAAQELAKLSLLVDGGEVDHDMVIRATVDSARFDVFGLVDVVLSGDSARAVRMLRGLRDEGTEPVVVGWALNRELRALTQMSQDLASGDSMQAVMNSHNVWSSRTSIVRKVLERLPLNRMMALFDSSMAVDRMVKGAAPGNPWDAMEFICLELASGQPTPLGEMRRAL